MKIKNFFAGIIAVFVAASLTALSVSAAVKDVSIKPNGPGQLYIIEDEMDGESYFFYFLDVYSSQAKLINASELEGATEFTIRIKATNATSYSDDIDVTLDIEVDENNPTGAAYNSDITLKGDGEYKISTKLDSGFKVDPNKLGIFLQLDFCGEDWPAKNQIPNIAVLEIIVKKDVADSDNTDNTDNSDSTVSIDSTNPEDTDSTDSANTTDNPEGTDSTDSADSTDSTVSTDSTDYTDSTDSTNPADVTDSTDSTANTENAADVSSAEVTFNDIESDTESHAGSITPLVVVLVVIAILLCGLASFIVVKKVKQKNKKEE